MRDRLRSIIRLRLEHLYVLEAALICLFFVQALRFLVGMLYSRIASASQYPALDPSLIDRALPGLVTPSTVGGEISFLVYMLALPLLALVLGRVRWLMILAALIAAGGRYLMVDEATVSTLNAASMVVGASLLYIAYVVRHRARVMPFMFVMAFGADQLYRAAGDTLDPSWSTDYAGLQLALSVAVVISTVVTVSGQLRALRRDKGGILAAPDTGLLTFASGCGLGGLLFLEMSLLALPNAIIGRAGAGYWLYPWIVPALIAATLLPLVPWVRARSRTFIGLFDSSMRGWSWMLLVALLIVFGTRFDGPGPAFALVAAQFCASMMWWWLLRPQAHKEMNFTGLWLVLAMLLFGLLTVADMFTYEYAFVRDFAPELRFLNNIIPPLLRGFRGLGLGVILLAILMASLPMVQQRRRIPWTSGSAYQTLLGLAGVVIASFIGAMYAQPPLIPGTINPETIRIGTYNIHAGYNEFFYNDLEAIAFTINSSGANIILLQEVEIGRMTSFGVDQALWLARRTRRDVRYYGTNENLQGLAVLSDIKIVYDDGFQLSSVGTQTGLQRVQVQTRGAPDEEVITIYNTWLGVLLEIDEQRSVVQQEVDQDRQLSEIFAIINTHFPGDQLGRSRTVIGGTFNNVPDSDLIERMRGTGLVDPFAGASPETSATYWRTGQRARLDYLWITRNLLPLEGALAIASNASDHRMAVIEARLR